MIAKIESCFSGRWFSEKDYQRADARLALDDLRAGRLAPAHGRLVAMIRTAERGDASPLQDAAMRSANWIDLGYPEQAIAVLEKALKT